jgi:hypothetical protein
VIREKKDGKHNDAWGGNVSAANHLELREVMEGTHCLATAWGAGSIGTGLDWRDNVKSKLGKARSWRFGLPGVVHFKVHRYLTLPERNGTVVLVECVTVSINGTLSIECPGVLEVWTFLTLPGQWNEESSNSACAFLLRSYKGTRRFYISVKTFRMLEFNGLAT